jgi:hypothetical protein
MLSQLSLPIYREKFERHWEGCLAPAVIGNETYNEVVDFIHHGDAIASPDGNAAHWHLAMQNAVHLH